MSTKLNCVSIPVSCFLGRKGPAFSKHLSQRVVQCQSMSHCDSWRLSAICFGYHRLVVLLWKY